MGRDLSRPAPEAGKHLYFRCTAYASICQNVFLVAPFQFNATLRRCRVPSVPSIDGKSLVYFAEIQDVSIHCVGIWLSYDAGSWNGQESYLHDTLSTTEGTVLSMFIRR